MKNLILISIFSFLTIFSFSQRSMNMQEVGKFTYTESLSDVWGYVDEGGNEYALVGVYDGFSIVDISDPANPNEVFFGSGLQSTWRDIKTYGDYAYVSNESGNGVYIVDMSPLPDGNITNTAYFTGDLYPFQTIHNLYVDELGRLYIFGSNNGWGGAIICDLTQDPMNPVELGRFNDFYLHDGMARDNILWGSALYQGLLAAIDVSDPANPVVVGTKSTPGQFTHNAWVSDDGSHVFTTDEISNGYLGAFNVTDFSNMYLTDRIQSSPGENVIPHNVHVNNDFLVTSYYTDGIVVHDAKFPDKLVEVANFDTSPNYSGSGYNGAWGAYPFLPSGLVLASDIQEGLYILEIDYVRASFLEGTVTDAVSGNALFNVQVEVLGTDLSTQTSFDGTYDFGSTISGFFDVVFSKEEYLTKTIQDVELINGEIVELDVELGDETVGISEELLVKTAFYPNPFSDQITLSIAAVEAPEQYQLTVYNTKGEELSRFSIDGKRETFTFGNELPAGMYYARLTDSRGRAASTKIIKR